MELFRAFNESGTQEPFDGMDNWAEFAGVIDGLLAPLAENTLIKDVVIPRTANALTLMRFGSWIRSTKLEASRRTALAIYMELAFPEHVARFRQGLLLDPSKMADGKGDGHERDDRNAPSVADQSEILARTGSSYQGSIVLAFVVVCLDVLTLEEVNSVAYGCNPTGTDLYKVRKKAGHLMLANYVKSNDAVGLRDRYYANCRSMAKTNWNREASTFMIKVQDIASMTIDKGRHGSFIDYWVEFAEQNKGVGLPNGSRADQDILIRTVVTKAQGAGDAEVQRMRDVMAEQAVALAAMKASAARAAERASALEQRLAAVDQAQKRDRNIDRRPTPGEGGEEREDRRPGKNQPCYKCGKVGHFAYECLDQRNKGPKIQFLAADPGAAAIAAAADAAAAEE